MAESALEAFGRRVSDASFEHPAAARRALIAAFEGEKLRSRLLPHRDLLPSAQTLQRLAVSSVADALAKPNESVITSIFMPSEIFLALGLKPLVAEAFANFVAAARAEEGLVVQAEQAGVSETYCSYHKVLMGAAAAGVLLQPPLIANCSVACDANNVTFRWLAERLDCAHTYIDVPYEYDEDACAYVAGQLRELAAQAQDVYQRKLDEDVLRAHVARSQQTLEALAATLPLRQGRYLQEDLALTMQEALVAHLLLGSQEALDAVRGIASDLAGAEPFAGPSVLWMHSIPFFSPALQASFNRSEKAQVIAAEMCFDQLNFEPWMHSASEPYEAMAERLIKDSFNGPAQRRIAHVEKLAQLTAADGVVAFCHWGCKETMGASQLTRARLEAAGIPVLVLDGDGCHRANNPEGQMSTRMDAFLEMLTHGKAVSHDQQ